MNEQDIYNLAIKKWGINSQIDMCIEECAELIVVLAKLGRKKNGISDLKEVVGELADVDICISQMILIFGDVEFRRIRYEKLKKLEQLVAE